MGLITRTNYGCMVQRDFTHAEILTLVSNSPITLLTPPPRSYPIFWQLCIGLRKVGVTPYGNFTPGAPVSGARATLEFGAPLGGIDMAEVCLQMLENFVFAGAFIDAPIGGSAP